MTPGAFWARIARRMPMSRAMGTKARSGSTVDGAAARPSRAAGVCRRCAPCINRRPRTFGTSGDRPGGDWPMRRAGLRSLLIELRDALRFHYAVSGRLAGSSRRRNRLCVIDPLPERHIDRANPRLPAVRGPVSHRRRKTFAAPLPERFHSRSEWLEVNHLNLVQEPVIVEDNFVVQQRRVVRIFFRGNHPFVALCVRRCMSPDSTIDVGCAGRRLPAPLVSTWHRACVAENATPGVTLHG